MRRRTVQLVAVLGAALLLAQGPALAERVRCAPWQEHTPGCVGTERADVLLGRPTRDHISGLGGDDRLKGLGRNDDLLGGNGNDRVSGGSGEDYIRGGAGDDVLAGGGGNDDLHGEDGNDRLSGGDGDDDLLGYSGNDELSGGAGDNGLDGGAGDDRLAGGGGGDVLEGWDGNDELVGGDGRDGLDGGAGDDRLEGGGGADVYTFTRYGAGWGHDTIVDAPIDGPFGATPWLEDHTLRISGDAADAVSVNLASDAGPAPELSSTDGGTAQWDGDVIDHVNLGNLGDDTVAGNDAPNWISASGRDKFGQPAPRGADAVSGRGGDDEISVTDGTGDDTVECGEGTDTVWFDAGDAVAADCEVRHGW